MATITKYNTWNENVNNGVNPIDWDTDTIKIALATASYTPNAESHVNFSDITNEVTGAQYTAGGETVAGITVTRVGATTTVSGSNVSWTQDAGGFTNARYGIIYKDTGVAATSQLVGYIDFVTDKGNTIDPFQITWNSNIFTQV